jgi:hypothetical protein
MRLYLVSFLLVLPALASALGAENPIPRKELQSAYATYDKAARDGMPGMQKWCDDNLSPDFSIVFLDGNTLNRKEYLDMIDRLIKVPAPAWKNIKSQKTRIKKLSLDSSDVVAMVEIETTYETKNPKHRTISLERPYRETWTKVGDTWKVKRSEELKPKPLPEAKRGGSGQRRPESPMPRGGNGRYPFPGGRPGYPNP